ncbi:hypothetical protein BSKO_06756 [Bryopsis sp. KO-2023]|nr:hypothetical protein BSKO_06756 [Bryopsis sp. KO-2023]
MGKPKKERAGRKRLRAAFEKLHQERCANDAMEGDGDVSEGEADVRNEVVAAEGEAKESQRPTKVERKLKKVTGLLDKVGKATLGVKTKNMKRKAARVQNSAVFSFDAVLNELGEAEVDANKKAARRQLARMNMRKQSNRLRMMAEFNEKIREVHSNPEFLSNPLDTAMKVLEETLPEAPTRDALNEKWRKEQSLLNRGRKKRRPKWHDKV